MSKINKHFKQKLSSAIAPDSSLINNFNTMILVDLALDEIIGWYNLPTLGSVDADQLIETLQATTNTLDDRFAFFLHREQNAIGEPTCVIIHSGKAMLSVDGFNGVETQMNTLMLNTMSYLTDQACAPPSFIINDIVRKQIQLILVIDKNVRLIDTLSINITQRLKNEADKGHAGCGLAYLRLVEPRTFAHLAPSYRTPVVAEGGGIKAEINCIQTPTLTIDCGVVVSVKGVTFQGSNFSVGLKMPDYSSGTYQVNPDGNLTKVSDI